MSARVSFLSAALNGYHFCFRCERVCDLRESWNGSWCCAYCGSPRVQWFAPLFPRPTLEVPRAD